MTRVYQQPLSEQPTTGVTRALVIGAGRYPDAKGQDPALPVLQDLTSVTSSTFGLVHRLIGVYRDSLATPLFSVDMLLSDATSASPAKWNTIGCVGEAANGTLIETATVKNTKDALKQALSGASTKDHFVFLCCGHGFWKNGRRFILGDFGQDAGNPWTSVIDLDLFAIGLREQAPRNQWLFFDCCNDMPSQVLETLGPVGDPLINPSASKQIQAGAKFGQISQFGLTSSTLGMQAFGTPNQPSRFCEMLFEALDGAGAVQRDNLDNQVWWIDQRGIEDAVKTYAARTPGLKNPQFYQFVMPTSSDTPGRMRFRSIREVPISRLVAVSVPPVALKDAPVTIHVEGSSSPFLVLDAPHERAKLHVDLKPPRRTYKVVATFDTGVRELEVFADLPLAEPVEFVL